MWAVDINLENILPSSHFKVLITCRVKKKHVRRHANRFLTNVCCHDKTKKVKSLDSLQQKNGFRWYNIVFTSTPPFSEAKMFFPVELSKKRKPYSEQISSEADRCDRILHWNTLWVGTHLLLLNPNNFRSWSEFWAFIQDNKWFTGARATWAFRNKRTYFIYRTKMQPDSSSFEQAKQLTIYLYARIFIAS